jgi:hypothetical protein
MWDVWKEVFKSKKIEGYEKPEFNEHHGEYAKQAREYYEQSQKARDELFPVFEKQRTELSICNAFLQDNYGVHNLDKIPKEVIDFIFNKYIETQKTYCALIELEWDDPFKTFDLLERFPQIKAFIDYHKLVSSSPEVKENGIYETLKALIDKEQ